MFRLVSVRQTVEADGRAGRTNQVGQRPAENMQSSLLGLFVCCLFVADLYIYYMVCIEQLSPYLFKVCRPCMYQTQGVTIPTCSKHRVPFVPHVSGISGVCPRVLIKSKQSQVFLEDRTRDVST